MENPTAKKFSTKKIVISAISALIVLGLVLSFVSAIRDMLWTDTNEAVMIDIPQGAGIAQISDILEEQGVIDHVILFRVYEKFAQERVYHSGVHKFYKGMSYGEALDVLAQQTHNLVTVTIPEGYEMRQIAALLEEKGVCTAADFTEAANTGDFSDYPYISEISRSENRLEGYLFPDTYEFNAGQAPHEVIEIMLKNFDNKVYSLYKDSGTEKTLDEIVVMASIIEREAANDEERGKIASVFYNRLEIGMKLQSCATVQYIIKERKKILSNSDIKIDSPYNTYIYEGLPLGPVASPGLASVKAAMKPEKTDYYYFAATADGSRNVFSKTGEEHMQTVKELQK